MILFRNFRYIKCVINERINLLDLRSCIQLNLNMSRGFQRVNIDSTTNNIKDGRSVDLDSTGVNSVIDNLTVTVNDCHLTVDFEFEFGH